MSGSWRVFTGWSRILHLATLDFERGSWGPRSEREKPSHNYFRPVSTHRDVSMAPSFSSAAGGQLCVTFLARRRRMTSVSLVGLVGLILACSSQIPHAWAATAQRPRSASIGPASNVRYPPEKCDVMNEKHPSQIITSTGGGFLTFFTQSSLCRSMSGRAPRLSRRQPTLSTRYDLLIPSEPSVSRCGHSQKRPLTFPL